MEPELEYPTLHLAELTAREQEVIATVLEDRLRSLFDLVMSADDSRWRELTEELSAEQLPGQGLIRSRLGMMNVLRRALGASPFELDALDILRKVGE
jgi:hypothetical protein